MMVPYLLSVSVVVALLLWHAAVHCEEEDSDDIKGPLIKPKDGGGLWTTAEIIEQHEYKAETHVVVTKKGYKLTVFRVVSKKQPPLGVVLLQHGAFLSSDGYVSDKDALAFKLADAGFCVWILNYRGNVYGRSHETLLPNQPEFWNFSFHEMAVEDLPDIIDYIIEKTGFNKVHYIGHSLGSAIVLIMISQRPEYNEKLISIVAFGPIMYLSKLFEMIGEDGMMEEMAGNYIDQFKKSKKFEVFPRADVPKDPQNQITCDDVGESFAEMCDGKMKEVQAVLGGEYFPAGMSTESLIHFFQCGRDGVMKRYKYDTPEENMKAYGKEEPPSYADMLYKINVPVFILSADFDQLILQEDVDKLKSQLSNVTEYHTDVECFDHIAFMFPRQKSCLGPRSQVYQAVINRLLLLTSQKV